MTIPTPDAPVRGPRHALPSRGNSLPHALLIVFKTFVALAAAGVLVVTGAGWAGQSSVFEGIITSQVLEGEPNSPGGEQNILIMGLDSRLDQHGRPLPQELYDALHAGDETAGGYNANVLIVLHIPANGGPVTAISIPRDDWVNLAGCPSDQCEGKVKQAYGLAYQEAINNYTGDSDDETAREQAAREAGRRAQIRTVRQLLQIPIDNFVEVTMVAFFQIAQVVQPLTVCLNEDTEDDFSGANFHKGRQEIDAAQAIAFVRQRRALNDETFTDLDRTRRQQAFMASLVQAVRHSGVLSSPTKLRDLLDVVKQNVAVDADLDLSSFAKRASTLTEEPLSFYTLPIQQFGKTAYGEDINLIDVPTIRAIVKNILATGSPDSTDSPMTTTTTTTPSAAPRASAKLDVVNATSYSGLATAVQKKLVDGDLTAGEVLTAGSISWNSEIEYGSGAEEAADDLAGRLHMTATASDEVEPGTVRLTVGGDFPADEYLDGSTSATASTSTDTTTTSEVPTVAATASGTQAPVPTELSRMTTLDGIPCVK